jgi:CRISPR-associated protein Cmr6
MNMTKAASPTYMDKHLVSQDIPPGHRFGLYFPIWKDDWKKADQEKTAALKKATSLLNASVKLAEALRQRQQAIALQTDALGYFPAISTSPFMTGIGNEHPLENGFAFLNPYGLPYFPGSSVKGVLRTAAEELALGLYVDDTKGWDMLSVWWLFGFEAGLAAISNKPYKGDPILVEDAKRRREKYQDWVTKGDYNQEGMERFINATVAKKDQKRYLEQPQQFLLNLPDDLSNQGVLRFWDVYPQSKSLAMDILTPHHGQYFRGEHGPHDSEQPIPNVFLTVPPGGQFDFYCTCETARLPNALQQNWKPLLQAAFAYAFDWLGFGAKTAVGYGQMRKDKDAEQALINQKNERQLKVEADAKQKQDEKRLADLPPFERDIEQLLKANKDPDKKGYLIILDAVKKGDWQGTDKQSVLERIKSLMQQAGDWRPTTQKRDPKRDKEHQRTLEVLRHLDQ